MLRKVLVIDNYDSFTWNLVQALGKLGAQPIVIRNDEARADQLEDRAPDGVVVSPGPCTPAEAGISVEAIRIMSAKVPILGVCLGHQAVAEAFGGRTVRARRVMHGKVAAIRHSGEGLFQGLPDPLAVARYHSLVTDPKALPDSLDVTAWVEPEGGDSGAPEIHGVRHRRLPVWGVQFHPESLFSQGGEALLRNFLHLA